MTFKDWGSGCLMVVASISFIAGAVAVLVEKFGILKGLVVMGGLGVFIFWIAVIGLIVIYVAVSQGLDGLQ